MIANIKKHRGPAPLLNYLLKPSKKPQLIQSSVFGAAVNRAFYTEEIITDAKFRAALIDELKESFARVNDLNPRLKNKMTHLILGFDPADGKLSTWSKAVIAKELIYRLGYDDTYWAVIAHDRDDPEHDHIHNHDHIHIVTSRINSYGKTISDSWDYPRTEKVLREMEIERGLQPFIPFWERDLMPSPEMYWMIDIDEKEQEKSKSISR
jgi:hypothetical protein